MWFSTLANIQSWLFCVVFTNNNFQEVKIGLNIQTTFTNKNFYIF